MANDIPDDIFKRLVLANQYKILALLDKGSAENWEAAAEIAQEFQPYTGFPGMDAMLDYRRDPRTLWRCLPLFRTRKRRGASHLRHTMTRRSQASTATTKPS
jgi:hypothetical protein